MKKLMALVLSVAMVLCAIPMTAFADTATNLSSVTVSTIADQTYSGEEINPAVVLKNGAATLTEGTDYKAVYSANVNVGTATVTLTGIGAYTGSRTVNFTIKPKAFTDTDRPTIYVPTQKVGETTFKDVEITWGKNALVEGTDYDISASGAFTEGTNTTGSVTFKGNYSGTISQNFNAVTNDCSPAAIFLTDPSAVYTFDGTAKTPAIYATLGGKTLVQGTDYEVRYADNVNAGTATIKLVGAGTYAGSKTMNFTINKGKFSDCKINLTKESYAYTGSAITPDFTVTLGAYTLKSSDYTVALADNTMTGKGTLTLTGAGNFDNSTLTTQFSIGGADVASLTCTLASDSVAYTGSALTPAVTVKDGATALVEGTDYTTEYKDNINSGIATVTITGIGKYSGTKTINFTVKGSANTVTTTYTNYKKYLTSQTFNLNAAATNVGTGLVYSSSDDSVATVSTAGDVTIKGIGVAVITVATAGTTSYDAAKKTVTVTVVPKKPGYQLTSTGAGKIKVNITFAEGATRYQIRYGRMGVYKNAYTSNSSRTLINLARGKNYFVKMRSYTKLADGSIIWGNWTSYKRIKVK